MPEAKQYVRTDEHGVMRVGKGKVQLEGIVYQFREGRSAESIRQCWPSLELEEIYGAIAYYLANRESVDEYLRKQEALYERLRAESERQNPAFYAKMREAKQKLTAGKASP